MRADQLDWKAVEFLVDGTATSFNSLRNGPDWEACSQSPEVWVRLDGRGAGGFPLDQVELVTVVDATPYIEGTRARPTVEGD